MASYTGKRVTVMGLGTRGGGLGVARYLAQTGAIVTVTDAKPADVLAEPMAALADLPIRFALGGHDEADFTPAGADAVVRNPGVPRRAPLLELARSHGLPVEMEMSLFFRACPAPVVGITGTKGKTTTSTLCGAMLKQWDPATVVAGNMGVSALDQLPFITPATPVVLEISSWQLEALAEHGFAPHIAILTNISEDHLNTYDGFDDYAETKRSITFHQTPSDIFIVNADDPEASKAIAKSRARIVPFGIGDPGTDGSWFTGSDIVHRHNGVDTTIPYPTANPALLGNHQGANAAAAAAAALVAGATPEAIAAALESFGGVKDRMERVADIDGVLYINDTAATAPAAAVAALEGLATLNRRIHLICGGADKKVALEPATAAAALHAYTAYLLAGTATPNFQALLRQTSLPVEGPFDSMQAAVEAAAAATQPGDIVILSPGCASFGLFRNEFHRGDMFRAAVAEIAARSR